MSVDDRQYVTFAPPPNPWARISRIAVKLGVQPYSGRGAVVMTGEDGNNYDVLEIVEKLIERLDDRDIVEPTGKTKRDRLV